MNPERSGNVLPNDPEWIEYKPGLPTHSPRRMVGKKQIVNFIDELKALDVSIAIQDEIIGPNRVAYCL